MMKTTTLAIASVAAIAALGVSTLALAQAKPPQTRAPAVPSSGAKAPARPAGGATNAAAPAAPAPPVITANIPGVCALSLQAIVLNSKAGKYMQTRLGQLQSQVNAELTAEATPLQAEIKAFDTKRAAATPQQLQTDTALAQQGASLQQRAEVFQQKRDLRDRELQATEQKAQQRVIAEASALVGDQIKAKNCAIVLDAQAVMAANASMDLSGGLVAALDGKFTQWDFDREHLDAQPVAPQR